MRTQCDLENKCGPPNSLREIQKPIDCYSVTADSSPPKAISITLNARARDIIERLRDDTGVPNTEAMARILEWFASQDRKFRLAVLTRDEETKRELVRLVLQEMAGMDKAGLADATASVTPREAVKVIRAMADKLAQQIESLESAVGERTHRKK